MATWALATALVRRAHAGRSVGDAMTPHVVRAPILAVVGAGTPSNPALAGTRLATMQRAGT